MSDRQLHIIVIEDADLDLLVSPGGGSSGPEDPPLDQTGHRKLSDLVAAKIRTFGEPKGWRVKRARSLRAMVSAIVSEAETTEYVELRVDLIGHGTPGQLSMGAGLSFSQSSSLNATFASKTEIVALRPTFARAKSAELRLFGCSVGMGDSGQICQYAVARAVGAPVSATTEAVRLEDLDEETLAGAPKWMTPIAPDGPLQLREVAGSWLRLPPLEGATATNAAAARLEAWAAQTTAYEAVQQLRELDETASKHFLALFDLDRAFDANSLLASTEQSINVALPEDRRATWSVVGGGSGLIVPHGPNRVLHPVKFGLADTALATLAAHTRAR